MAKYMHAVGDFVENPDYPGAVWMVVDLRRTAGNAMDTPRYGFVVVRIPDTVDYKWPPGLREGELWPRLYSSMASMDKEETRDVRFRMEMPQ